MRERERGSTYWRFRKIGAVKTKAINECLIKTDVVHPTNGRRNTSYDGIYAKQKTNVTELVCQRVDISWREMSSPDMDIDSCNVCASIFFVVDVATTPHISPK